MLDFSQLNKVRILLKNIGAEFEFRIPAVKLATLLAINANIATIYITNITNIGFQDNSAFVFFF